jgi:uncharacterized membrane protein
MRKRMTIALLSVIAGYSALYLHLYKLGKVGSLSCTSGGCDRAIFSRYGWFLGVDVGLIGLVGYILILTATLVTLQPGLATRRWPFTLLFGLALGGFIFTLRLKYAEFVILKTFCPWCAISAVSITIITVLSWLEWRAVRGQPAS